MSTDPAPDHETDGTADAAPPDDGTQRPPMRALVEDMEGTASGRYTWHGFWSRSLVIASMAAIITSWLVVDATGWKLAAIIAFVAVVVFGFSMIHARLAEYALLTALVLLASAGLAVLGYPGFGWPALAACALGTLNGMGGRSAASSVHSDRGGDAKPSR